jgi:pilus assembly protein TadC
MSSKKRKKEPEPEIRLPLMQRPKFKLFYTMAVLGFFSLGIILLILSYSIWADKSYAMFIALGVLGVGIILLTMRSSHRGSAPSSDKQEEEKEKDKDTLKMRTRR